MVTRYYQEELTRLKELAADFAAAHPALAPMLAGPSTDPDVERLLEGVAFQNGLLRQKLDDDFPELIHDLVRLACPHYLTPVPSATVVAFSPRPSLTHSRTIPAGAQLASVPIANTRCLFRTCTEVELHPLELQEASFSPPSSDPPAIDLSLALREVPLQEWSPGSLRLFLGGEYAAAADIYFLLLRHLRRIVIAAEEGGRPAILPPECLRPAGLAEEEAVIPCPSHAYPGYRLIQEYFAFPQRFLFLELKGWERWVERGSGSRFTVRFELSPFSMPPPRVKRESFVLFAAPAVNLFPQPAEPVMLDHRKERYLIRPEGLSPEYAQVFSVDRVTGFARGRSGARTYRPFGLFHPALPTEPVFHAGMAPQTARTGFDLHLSFPYSGRGEGPEPETLSIELTCSNGALAERLRVGDLCNATASSPESATFRNIIPVTASMVPPLGKNLLWRFVSHLSLNHSSLASAEKVRALLALYLFEEGNQDQSALAANRQRIDGIKEMLAHPVDRLLRGMPIRGTELRIGIDGDHFAGRGDLFLFGSVLDSFLGGYATLNTFTRLTVHDTSRDETMQWPSRLGVEPLV